METFETETFATIKSKRYPGMTLVAIPEPDDPPGTMAVPVVVPYPDGRFVVAKLRLHDSFGEVRIGPLMSEELFASLDEAGDWALEQLDVAAE